MTAKLTIARPSSERGGWVLIGDRKYRNQWVPDGTAIRQPVCWICLDSGRETTDDDTPGPICDCRAGDALRGVSLCDSGVAS